MVVRSFEYDHCLSRQLMSASIAKTINCYRQPGYLTRGRSLGSNQGLAKKQRLYWFLIHDSENLMKKVFLDSIIGISDCLLTRNNSSKSLILESFFELETVKLIHLLRTSCFFTNLWFKSANYDSCFLALISRYFA